VSVLTVTRFAAWFAPLLACLPGFASADQLPLWEAGAGVSLIQFPDYRGSDERQFYVLPVPYFVYRGDFLKVDRQKIRGLFFSRDWAELDFSISGSVPVKSSENDARRGMDDLDPTLEFGPSFNIHLHQSRDSRVELDLRLPLRTVFATDLRSFRQTGWVFEPRINLDLRDTLLGAGWNVGLAAGPLFATRRNNQYFYGVESGFVTPARSAYQANGGYGGMQFLAAVSKRYPKFWVGGFASLTNLNGAAYEDSPLVRTKNSFATGVAISWIFKESKTMVEAKE
jgi:MipA family protein